MDLGLDGRRAIVTGGSKGLGLAIARELVAEGATVRICARNADEVAAAVAELGEAAGGRAVDVREANQLAGFVEWAAGDMGGLDILVNNAGLIRREDAISFSERDWDDVMDLNIKSVFFMSQAAAKHFIAQGSGGKIINIASMLSFQGGIRVPSYTASKSAVMGVTRLLANEWAKHNINVNAIAPGYMATNNTQQLRADEQRSSEILDRIPAGRWGLPADLMGPVVFLASSASDYINGYTVAVDGGWLAR